MIAPKGANFMRSEVGTTAKRKGDLGNAKASARLSYDIQDKICRLQPVDGILNILWIEKYDQFYKLHHFYGGKNSLTGH